MSASAKNWIEPILDRQIPNRCDIEYLTTELETDENGFLTGKFAVPNCNGSEKVRRIKEIFPNRSEYFLTAYGDSHGDKEMLAEADESFYRVFRGKKSKTTALEAIRFCIVGALAVIIQYVCYRFLLKICAPVASNTVSYIVSMSANFVLSSLFTFRVKPSAKRLAGFLFSHAINYSLQTAILSAFLYLGMSKKIAPIPVYALCVPTNFLLVRFFLKR